MAVTAVQLDTKSKGGTLCRRPSEGGCSEVFTLKLDAPSDNYPVIASQANALSARFPNPGQAWPPNVNNGWYAETFAFANIDSDLDYRWKVTVTYKPLQPGEQNTENGPNPLLWPAVYWLEWIEFEEAVTQGRNIQAIGPPSIQRAADQLGPIVNGALQEFEEGLVKTTRQAVLCIQKNVATLDQVLAVESAYQNTTNSDTVYGIGPRRYEYLSVDSGGVQNAAGQSYYARVARVKISETTDRTLLNIGWHNRNLSGKLVKYRVEEVDEVTGDSFDPKKYVEPSEPGFLTLLGARSNTPVSVGYRILRPAAYLSLLTGA